MKRMKPQTSYRYLGIAEVGELVRQGEVSPVEVVTACLERIGQLNPKLNAFITVTADQALEQAKKAEAEVKAGSWRGLLHGIPVGIKDFYDTAGIKTTAAFGRFLLLPTTTTTVPTIKDAGANPRALSPENTAFANYYGLPSISVPCGIDANGLPLGLQIVAKPWDEEAVLGLASQYEQATPWKSRHPAF